VAGPVETGPAAASLVDVSPDDADIPADLVTSTAFVGKTAGSYAGIRPYFDDAPWVGTLDGKVGLASGEQCSFCALFPPRFCVKIGAAAGEEGTEAFSFEPFLCAQSWEGENTMSGFLARALAHKLTLCRPQPAGVKDGLKDGGQYRGGISLYDAFVRGLITVRNNTKAAVELEKLCLAPLAIYRKGPKDGNGGVSYASDTVVMEIQQSGEIRTHVQTPEWAAAGGWIKVWQGEKANAGEALLGRGASLFKTIARN
jgi:hypothetical protein